MQYYLEHNDGKFWQIELDGLLLMTRTGNKGTVGDEKKSYADDFQAGFQSYKDQIIEQLNADYVDPRNGRTAVDFEDATYNTYLEQKEYEKAIAWLGQFEGLIDGTYEERLMKSYIEDKNYTDAERYILLNIKSSKLADVIIRQVRYLAVVNPMMCRFMIGNLPAEPQAKDLNAYYRNLALAQSGIGMLDVANSTMSRIKDFRIQFTYLSNLLNTPNKNLSLQLKIFDRAADLLEQNIWETELKVSNYLLLSKMAQGLGQAEKVTEFLEKAKHLSEE